MKLLICDDEKAILNGLQKILNWQSLGFTEIMTANKGDLALDIILKEKPALTLIDINMPVLDGLAVINEARDKGFEGDFIIISGFSEFSYAQKAISLNVTSYLCKPIDDDELLKVVESIVKKLETSSYKTSLISTFESIAIKDYLFKILDSYDEALESFGLITDDHYQILAYEKYYQKDFSTTDSFKELLDITDNIKYTSIYKDNLNLIILIGRESIDLVSRSLKYYTADVQKNSLLDNTFLYFGETVANIKYLPESYQTIKYLVNERFFCNENQHFLYSSYLRDKLLKNVISLNTPQNYADNLFKAIQSTDIENIKEQLANLMSVIKSSQLKEVETKNFLTNMFLITKNQINLYYTDIPLLTASFTNIATDIENKVFLYEISDYIFNQLSIVINTISQHSKDTIVYEIIEYIDKNFYTNLKLKAVAEHFNYNSSYFGKLFTKTFDCSFNTYLEKVRIEKSKKLLENEKLKVYEVCEIVGYNNVDYFHKKFKSIVGISPLEYRKQIINKKSS